MKDWQSVVVVLAAATFLVFLLWRLRPRNDRDGTLSATGHYMRAMRVDPSWTVPVLRLRHLLWRTRPRRLERILWRRLSQLGWYGDERPVVMLLVRTLAELYRVKLRDRAKAQVLERVLRELEGAAGS